MPITSSLRLLSRPSCIPAFSVRFNGFFGGVSFATLSLALIAFVAPAARAQVLYQPVAVTTNMGQYNGGASSADFNLNNVISQSGLSSFFVSGTTPNATYTATHDSSLSQYVWASAIGTPTGDVDFDLGQSRSLSAFVFWNLTPSAPAAVATFSLSASNNADFSSATNLGSFTTASSGASNAVNKETFSFSSTSARYVRMSITSNSGGASLTGFGKAALVGAGASAAPEPASLGLLLSAVPAIGLVLCRRKKTIDIGK